MGVLRIDSAQPALSQTAVQRMTLPIVLIALLKLSQFAVHLNRARDDSNTWSLRFSSNTLLQVGDDGHWSWRRGSQRWRQDIAPLIARAEAMLEEARAESSSVDQTRESHDCIGG